MLALALARAAAHAGLRTIAIDADYPYRLESLISSTRPPNSGVPAVGTALDDFVKADPLSPALVMTADRRMMGHEGIPDPSVLARLIVNLKKNADLLIITSPALGNRSIVGLGDMLLVASDGAAPAQPALSRSGKPTLTVITQAQSAS
jgi:Mrp family chromosome partitioning ATPase